MTSKLPYKYAQFLFFLAPTPYNLSSIIHLIKQHSNHCRRGENQSILLPITYLSKLKDAPTFVAIIDHIKKERKCWKLKLKLKSESIQVNSQTTLTIFYIIDHLPTPCCLLTYSWLHCYKGPSIKYVVSVGGWRGVAPKTIYLIDPT